MNSDETNLDCAKVGKTMRVLDWSLVVVALAYTLAMLVGGGCVNQYKNRVSVEVPAGATVGPISITVEDRGDQVPTTTKNVIPSITAPLVP